MSQKVSEEDSAWDSRNLDLRANMTHFRETVDFFPLGHLKNKLKTKGILGQLKVNGRYFGIGCEFTFGILGLAFEIAQRQISLENNLSIVTSSPSIGIHFYKHL